MVNIIQGVEKVGDRRVRNNGRGEGEKGEGGKEKRGRGKGEKEKRGGEGERRNPFLASSSLLLATCDCELVARTHAGLQQTHFLFIMMIFYYIVIIHQSVVIIV